MPTQETSLEISQNLGRESFLPNQNLFRFLRFNPRITRVALVAAPLLAAAGYLISQLPIFEQTNMAKAQELLFPSSAPKPEYVSKSHLASKEALQIIQNPIEFNIGIDHYLWSYNNASYNINPPNELVIPTGTIRVVKNGTYMSDQDFQGLQRLYSGLYGGLLTDLNIKGMAVNTSLNRFSLVTATARPLSSTLDVHVESGFDITNAKSYLQRQMVDKGLPAGGFSGAFSAYVTEGRDDRGNWINVMFAGCDISSQDGTYQIRRDNSGNIIGDTFVKLSNSVVPGKPFQTFLPVVFDNY